ncbi:M23 family metallopeptidase [Desulfovibrio sp. OttesenSCG-928-C06]|nr:M23 family metallopeptidase [Desulfovibrio sp. OttesenSCG-928-C06]
MNAPILESISLFRSKSRSANNKTALTACLLALFVLTGLSFGNQVFAAEDAAGTVASQGSGDIATPAQDAAGQDALSPDSQTTDAPAQNTPVAPARFSHPASVAAGEPFLLSIESDTTLEGVTVEWLGKSLVLGLENNGQPDNAGTSLRCILPVPLNSKEKSLPLRVTENLFGKTVYSGTVAVTQRDYPVQELTVAPKYVNPDPETVKRAQAESKKNRSILTQVSPVQYWELPLRRPVKGIITSEYGFKRVFNGEPRSQHRAVDFRGAEGTPILASADGKVMLAEEQHYSGNFVIIDHGLGVFSMYAHLSKFEVKEGDFVKKGQLVGLVGKTGRVTGPHLHFGFSVLGESVTPEPFITNFRVKESAPAQKPAKPAQGKAPAAKAVKPAQGKAPAAKK